MVLDELYAIGAGYNVALVSLLRISSIDPGDGDKYDPPKALPLYDDGQIESRLDGHLSTQGYTSVKLFFTRLSYLQYSYWKTTYAGGGLSGEVTAYLTLGSSTFVRKNAIMIIRKPVEMDSEFRYKNVEMMFTRLTDPT